MPTFQPQALTLYWDFSIQSNSVSLSRNLFFFLPLQSMKHMVQGWETLNITAATTSTA